MPSKLYTANQLHRLNATHDMRRQLAELRVCYGNALSNFNLKRMRGAIQAAQTLKSSSALELNSPLTNAYSWQLTDLSTRRQSLPPLMRTTPQESALPIPPWDQDRYIRNVDRCYWTLQKQAEARAKQLAKQQQQQQSPMQSARRKKRVDFMVTYCNTGEAAKNVEKPNWVNS